MNKETGIPLLQDAIYKDKFENLSVIRNSGYPLEQGLKPGRVTIAHLCAKYGSIRSLLYFHINGYNLNIEDNDGNTPLHIAVENNQKKCAAFLKKIGLDPWKKNKIGICPVDLSIDEELMGFINQIYGQYASEFDENI